MLIQEYNPNWKNDFEAIHKVLHETLSNHIIAIEHIGSTSVPHLAAKHIIDIDVIYDRNTDFEAIKTRLESIGYFHNGNQGIENREVFKRSKIVKNEVLDKITHHLYVCPNDSEELQRHILFRDYLRSDETARIQYQKLKYEIAEAINQDKKKYAALKELKAKDFIDGIIERAKIGKGY
ncbi:GrpB family protein [Arcicella sp. LKC2W]|uniref:GrpB family protein n=1 Tax=Arcicella sp. LKC2W TaxID=2984198 RepID=UPI002B1F858F|nr:GrpB family protein [Arcicella sp. LKC2W]MEA5459913.1 GrpB family protein [Arcicella sp. LKC2W]